MICPHCGADVPEKKFCENCGCSLPEAQEPTQQIAPETEPMAAAVPAAQPTEPVPRSFAAEVPGDSAWKAQPEQVYQTETTMEMPPQQAQQAYQPDPTLQMPQQQAGAYVPPQQQAGAYTPPAGGPQAPYQPPYQQPSPYQPAPTGNQAPNAAFVLVIVGLVLSILFVTFVPGLVCSIIGLVLNAGYNKKGMDNPRKTPTNVIGIIGIVVGVLCLITTIAIGVFAMQVVEEADRQGVDITAGDVSASVDSSGHLVFTTGSSSSASAASSASESSTSASTTNESSASASTSAESAAASSTASGLAVYEQSKYHDSEWNPTLYAVLELTGTEMNDLLEHYNFYWDDDYKSWIASDGSLYGAADLSGELSKSELAALPAGAAGQPVALYLTVEGYEKPAQALKALSADVLVIDEIDGDSIYFAQVENSKSARYLVCASDMGNGEQSFIVFTDEAVSGLLFNDIVGFGAGNSIDDIWSVIKLTLS